MDKSLAIARGAREGISVIHKFGFSDAIGTSLVPVCNGNVYQTPQTATPLRIKAGGNANDDAAGTGARSVTLYGIGSTGALISETIATNGISASAATSQSFLRLFRFYVASSGTYATQDDPSHAGNIVIEDSGGAADWATIDSTIFPTGQSQIGAYTVPAGYTAYLTQIYIAAEANKSVTALLFTRENILESAAPYSPMREKLRIAGVAGFFDHSLEPAFEVPSLADVVIKAMVSTGTGSVAVTMKIVLIENGSRVRL